MAAGVQDYSRTEFDRLNEIKGHLEIALLEKHFLRECSRRGAGGEGAQGSEVQPVTTAALGSWGQTWPWGRPGRPLSCPARPGALVCWAVTSTPSGAEGKVSGQEGTWVVSKDLARRISSGQRGTGRALWTRRLVLALLCPGTRSGGRDSTGSSAFVCWPPRSVSRQFVLGDYVFLLRFGGADGRGPLGGLWVPRRECLVLGVASGHSLPLSDPAIERRGSRGSEGEVNAVARGGALTQAGGPGALHGQLSPCWPEAVGGALGNMAGERGSPAPHRSHLSRADSTRPHRVSHRSPSGACALPVRTESSPSSCPASPWGFGRPVSSERQPQGPPRAGGGREPWGARPPAPGRWAVWLPLCLCTSSTPTCCRPLPPANPLCRSELPSVGVCAHVCACMQVCVGVQVSPTRPGLLLSWLRQWSGLPGAAGGDRPACEAL